MTIGDLSRQFSEQRLSAGSYEQLSASADAYTPADDGLSYMESPYANLTAPMLRTRRQAATRLQCDPAHLRDISALVEKMVDRGDQCAVSSPQFGPSSSSSSKFSDVDADVDDDEIKTLGSSRRTSASVSSSYTGKLSTTADGCPSSSGVSKRVRLCKYRDRVKGWSRKR